MLPAPQSIGVSAMHLLAHQSLHRSLLSLSLLVALGGCATVGSMMIQRTFSPQIMPASFAAWRWTSMRYAGTVITACSAHAPPSR